MNLRSAGIAALLLLTSAATACGTESGSAAADEPPSKIVRTDGTYDFDDFLAVGFKKSKTFDVEGLTGAVDVFYGFWGLDPYDRKEFEARFYLTHSDAVEFGTSFAEERIGQDAKLKIDEATLKQGLKEARACVRGRAGYNDSSDCSVSRYGDYVIYSNVILVCEGTDASTARKNCDALLAEFQ